MAGARCVTRDVTAVPTVMTENAGADAAATLKPGTNPGRHEEAQQPGSADSDVLDGASTWRSSGASVDSSACEPPNEPVSESPHSHVSACVSCVFSVFVFVYTFVRAVSFSDRSRFRVHGEPAV